MISYVLLIQLREFVEEDVQRTGRVPMVMALGNGIDQF
jgi:hypothetical protein